MDGEIIESAIKQPGIIALFGSGETSASGRRVYDWLFKTLSQPVLVAVVETPAGFQPNSAAVAEDVATFMRKHLRNYRPEVIIVPARRRGTPFSPDSEEIVEPVLKSDVIFLGPGSPTYAVRQLQDSIAWNTIVACQRQGAILVLASAATIAASLHTLPVYEIYKVGEDLRWSQGLDMFGPYGLRLVFVSHWNNTEGGAELDTSHCYIGRARFEQLLSMLPSEVTIVGIDEHTALIIDMINESCRVMGKGAVTLLRQGKEQRFESGKTFAITELGSFRNAVGYSGIPPDIWERVSASRTQSAVTGVQPPPEVMDLTKERERARRTGDWAIADTIRQQIHDLGWELKDAPGGSYLVPRQE